MDAAWCRRSTSPLLLLSLLLLLLCAAAPTGTGSASPAKDAVEPPAWLTALAFPERPPDEDRHYAGTSLLRWRSAPTTSRAAVELWVDCVKHHHTLNVKDEAYCSRLEHRISRLSSGLLTPRVPSSGVSTNSDNDANTLESFRWDDGVRVQDFLEEVSIPKVPVRLVNIGRDVLDNAVAFTSDECLRAGGIAEADLADGWSRPLDDVCADAFVRAYRPPRFIIGNLLRTVAEEMPPSGDFHQVDAPVLVVGSSPGLRMGKLGSHTLLVVLRGSINLRLHPAADHRRLRPRLDASGRRLYGDVQDGSAAEPRGVIQVTSPDGVFVPTGTIFSWSSSPDDAAGPRSHVMLHQFVDVGAANAFRDELMLHAKEHAELISLANATLANGTGIARTFTATHMQSRGFDQWISHRRVLASSSGEIQEDTRAATASASPRPRSRDRRSRLKAWQQQKQWERRLVALVPPVPRILPGLRAGSSSISFEVAVDLGESVEQLQHQVTGFALSAYSVSAHTDLDELEPATTRVISLERDCSSPTRLEPGSVPGATTTSAPRTYSCLFAGLEMNTTYVFRVATKTEEAVGPFSRSAVAETGVPAAPMDPAGAPTTCGAHLLGDNHRIVRLCVQVEKPFDDGGSPLTGYVARWRVDSPFRGYMTSSHRIIEVSATDDSESSERLMLWGLVPNATILLEVAAVNEHGVGDWSPPGRIWVPDFSPSTVVDSRLVHTLLGDSTMDAGSSGANVPLRAETPIATVHESSERVAVRYHDGLSFVNKTLEGWHLHHSRQTHKVHGHLAMADPEDASAPIRNTDEARGSVLLVRRGKVTFREKVRHAQEAGALAVIFLDHGRCDSSWKQSCVPGARRSQGEGFAMQDHPRIWQHLDLPAMLVLKEDAAFLKDLLDNPMI